MAIIDALTGLNTETALQRSKDLAQQRADSVTYRTTGSTMGKNDFLMLLSAQLRYQDPMEPTKDSDFAAQLAQFSSLEQMQNMNETLSAMVNYQAYGLVGKYVLASAMVDGVWSQIPGIVDSVFTKNYETFAQIGNYTIPISAITDVFDSSSMLTPDNLIQTSSNLIGRTVIAQVGEKVYEGIVTRLTVDGGQMFAMIDDGVNEQFYVPVGSIYDIRQTDTSVKAQTTPDPEAPPAEDKGEEAPPVEGETP